MTACRRPCRLGTVGIRLLRSGEWDRKEGVLVVLFENDDGAREFAALAIGLVADVLSQSDPPHFAFAKIQSCGFIHGVGGFLDAVPVIEIRLHTMVANIIPRAAWASDLQGGGRFFRRRICKEMGTMERGVEGLYARWFRFVLGVGMARW
jgi:hypothetical protein